MIFFQGSPENDYETEFGSAMNWVASGTSTSSMTANTALPMTVAGEGPTAALVLRRYARSIASEFVEIHLNASPEILEARGRSRDGLAYEAPVQPELRLDTGRLSLDEAGAEVIAWLQEWSSQS